MADMSEQEAAARLISRVPDEPVVVEEKAEIDEVIEEQVDEKVGPPRRLFRWVDDSRLTIDTWLSGLAAADIEVFPGVVFRFHEAKSSLMREADAVVNSMGPSFVMAGLIQPDGSRDDFMRGEQWARARNIAMVAISVTHMGGEKFPPGETIKEKFNALDDMGHIKLDRLIMAFSEFTAQLAHIIEKSDLPNS